MAKFPKGFVILFCFLLLAGCATSSLERVRDRFYRGEIIPASELARKKTVARQNKDALLYLLEEGLIHHCAGEYEASNTVLLAAADLAEELEVVQPVKETAGLLINDRLRPYKGEAFEKVLIHTYAAINFLHLRQWEDALVECKRALRRLEKSENDRLPHPFTHYLAARTYELMGDADDARIEYEKVRHYLPGIAFLEDDLRRVRRSSGGENKLRAGELICFVGMGKSPVKESAQIFLPPDKRFVFPVYRKRRAKFSLAKIYVDGNYAGRSYLFTDVEALAVNTLKEKTVQQAVRTSARLITKEQIANKIEKKVSRKAARFWRLLFFLTEKADTRCWQTLPASLQVARIPLTEGTHEVSVRFVTGWGEMSAEKNLGSIEVQPGKPVFLSARAF